MRSPGEEILRKAVCRRERTTKRLQMEATIIAHAWLTPANFSCCTFLLRVLAPIASHCFGALVESAGGARGRHALRLRSRPERASDMHPQAPNTQTFLPASPSAPERTLQASGQGQAIARPKGGPPCCSVPVPSTRWAAIGASPPLKTSCVCLYQDKLTHAHVRTCATQ